MFLVVAISLDASASDKLILCFTRILNCLEVFGNNARGLDVAIYMLQC